MIHNGIEYGMMQAIGRRSGNQVQHSPLGLELDKVTAVWQRGVLTVSGLLMDMTAASLAREPDLQSIEGIVAASGEANWTVNEAFVLVSRRRPLPPPFLPGSNHRIGKNLPRGPLRPCAGSPRSRRRNPGQGVNDGRE